MLHRVGGIQHKTVRLYKRKSKINVAHLVNNTICRGEKITDLCHGSGKKNHSYIKNSQNVLHLEYSKYISKTFFFKSNYLEKA